MKRQNLRKAMMVFAVLSLPVTMFYLSPLLTVQGAAKGIVTASLIFAGIIPIVAAFAGRIFCGWLCPGGAVQELLFPANNRRVRGGKLDLVKYGVTVAWLLAIVVLFFRAEEFSIAPLFGIEGGVSLGTAKSYVMFYVAMGGLAVLSLFVGRRPFCHYGCLLAPLMIVGKRASKKTGCPSLHLEADTELCIHCNLCTKNCPMSLDVHAMVQRGDMENSECISCGACVDSCPKGVLSFAFSSGEMAVPPEKGEA